MKPAFRWGVGLAAMLGLVVFMLGCSLGWIVDRLAIRDAGQVPPSVGNPAFVVSVAGGPDMPVHSIGSGAAGCVVLFPGQHGLAGGFEALMAPLLASRGIAAFTVTYAATPRGRPLTLRQAQGLAASAVEQVEKRCGRRYVVVGRSLGAMAAAYAVQGRHPAALLLEGASPSLASALRALPASWLGRRIAQWLPLEGLLIQDYSLNEALGAGPQFPVTLIQGDRDVRAPLADLMVPGAIPPWVDVLPVEGADHAGVWQAFMPQYIDRIAAALAHAGT